MSDSGTDVGGSLTTGDVALSTERESNQTGQLGTVPLVMVTAYQDKQQRQQDDTLPKLPSHQFRYSVWHDLSHTAISGDQLKAPRLRYGPPEKEKYFHKIRNENNQRIHHTRKGRDRRDYRDKTENWENTEHANVSYQELGQNYQMSNFLRVLKRLMRVQELNLTHNNLVDLSGITFPVCTSIVLNINYLDSLKHLPRLPRVIHLVAEDNYICDLAGLDTLRKTPIETMSLCRNPVAFTLNYRQRVFQTLPQLKVLDGVPKMPEDDTFDEDNGHGSKGCVVS